MSKATRVSLALSGLILFGAGCAKQSATQESPQTEGPGNSSVSQQVEIKTEGAPVPAVPGEAVIEYKDGIFNPATLRALTGTKVTFVNKGAKEVWPASGIHPTHQICPGFDAKQALKSGKTYSFTFTKAGDCPFHNHLAPAEKGKIEVKTE